MRQEATRRKLLRDFAWAAKLAKAEGDLETWRAAVHEWWRLATPGERKRAPAYMGFH